MKAGVTVNQGESTTQTHTLDSSTAAFSASFPSCQCQCQCQCQKKNLVSFKYSYELDNTNCFLTLLIDNVENSVGYKRKFVWGEAKVLAEWFSHILVSIRRIWTKSTVNQGGIKTLKWILTLLTHWLTQSFVTNSYSAKPWISHLRSGTCLLPLQ